jgi:hypothetical protein
MASRRVFEGTRRRVEHAVADRREVCDPSRRDECVEAREEVSRRLCMRRKRRQRRAQLAHHSSSLQPVADNVSYRDGDPPVPERNDVVPVTSDFQRRASGLVSCCDRHARRNDEVSRK